jgi:hypothetical protein
VRMRTTAGLGRVFDTFDTCTKYTWDRIELICNGIEHH